jgi:hypothetical protein
MVCVVNRPVYGRFAGALISKPITPVVEFFPMPFNLPDVHLTYLGRYPKMIQSCVQSSRACASRKRPHEQPCPALRMMSGTAAGEIYVDLGELLLSSMYGINATFI